MEIIYLVHSGFLVRDGRTLLVFDDYRDPSGAVEKALEEGEYDRLYIFASHAHFDHFDPHIHYYSEQVTQYIFSEDIRPVRQAAVFSGEKVTYMKTYETWSDEFIRVNSFDSTDEGTSFLVSTPEKHRIFHAGDFNWWHWEGDTRENQLFARNAFRKQMSKLEGLEADLAFFPVDERLGDSWDMGVKVFLNETRVKSLITMHNAGGKQWKPKADFFEKREPVPYWTPSVPGERRLWTGKGFQGLDD